MPDRSYVELRCQSAFSFLEAAALPEELVQRAAALDLPGFALSDRGTLSGAVRVWKAGRESGIRTIVGAQVDLLEPGGRLLLLVTSPQGYRHLCRLLTLGHARGGKQDCIVSFDEIEENAKDLICLAGGPHGALTEILRSGRGDLAMPLVDRLGGLFPGRLWVDLQRNLNPFAERRLRKLRDLAIRAGVPMVATGEVRATGVRGSFLLDVLESIRRGVPICRLARAAHVNREYDFANSADMLVRFRDLPGTVAASVEIADLCRFRLDELGYRFPEVPLPDGATSISRLHELVRQGARGRWGDPLPLAVGRQLEHELGVIGRLSLEGYFLIVEEIVSWCRAQGILVQGRGSAANSAVCYALGITAVDAVGMGLLFERFLSEERREWPDIDLDLPSGERREAVIQYVYRRFGGSGDAGLVRTVGAGVAMTANVITWRMRSALREAARALNFSPLQINHLVGKLGESGLHEEEKLLADTVRTADVDVSPLRLQQLARCIEGLCGLPRHLGQHSGGIIVAAGRLDEIVPLEPANMPGRSVVQWDKDDCADLGIIKIDLLGLGMMAVLEEAIPLVEYSEGIHLDLAHLPSDDSKTWAMIQKADTVGVFQIESRAQMATLPRMKPATFYDLVVEVALIRPGPIVGRMVHPYLARRAGREAVRYAHPCLEPILKRTLGIPLFQEQILRVAMVAAGFTGGEAEELRRAMGFKRSTEKMQALELRLRQGLERQGIVGAALDEIVRSIGSFAMYGFPESHAASFALLAWASAYLKAHHPAAFLCALLNAWPMGFYHPSTLVKDAQRHGVEVRPIDVSLSDWRCTLERQETGRPAVRLGFRFVRGLRQEVGAALVQARGLRPWRDLADFMARVTLNREERTALAELGALSSFGGAGRRAALWQVLAFPGRREAPLLRGHAGAESSGAVPVEMDPFEEVLADYRMAGLTVGPQLLSRFRPWLREQGALPLSELASLEHGQDILAGGLVIVRQKPAAARGFCFLTLEDETGIASAVLTPGAYARLRRDLNQTALVLVQGRVERREGVVHLRIRHLGPLDSALAEGDLPPSHDYY